MSYASIEDASLDELAHILSYLETRDGDKPPVLIGVAGPCTPTSGRSTSEASTSTSS